MKYGKINRRLVHSKHRQRTPPKGGMDISLKGTHSHDIQSDSHLRSFKLTVAKDKIIASFFLTGTLTRALYFPFDDTLKGQATTDRAFVRH